MRFWRRSSAPLIFVALTSVAHAQTPATRQATKSDVTRRANEMTLAGLRPGKDSMVRARQLNQRVDAKSVTHDTQTVWLDVCRSQVLAVDFDTQQVIQVVRAAANTSPSRNCEAIGPGAWKTGRGLGVGDPADRLLSLYGEPDSRSPSTKGGQPLELWYYAFDWAGANVPQVMEVLCTVGNAGQPGRVVEITLAAPSL
jgi:hypothetical protein